jgi:hypothetical protein
MARLAAVSGGKVIDPSDPGSVAGLLDRSGDTSVTTSIRKIRGKLWLFLAIVLVFSAEWLLRKLFGLV